MSTSLKPAFVFDVNRCVGCRACEMACVNANHLPLRDLPASGSWREVRTFNELKVSGVEVLHLSLACNHCAEAPCLEQCPARAYSRDAETGAVLIDQDRCLGCRYCAWVCPYDAPRFNEALGVMTKCTFCVDRQHEGGQPACTLSCPTGALTFALRSPDQLTQQVVGFAQADTRPAVDIVGLFENRRIPDTHLPPSLPPWRVLWNKINPQITFRHEWALAVFTLLLAVLTGLLAGHLAGRLTLSWPLFLATGAAGMLLSAAHLGQRARAWRAALHLDRSWLSREIILSGLFLALGGVGLLLSPENSGAWATRGALYLGLITLFTVDLVYRPAVIRGSGPLHSAHTLGTGLMLMAVAAGDPWVFIPLAILKTVLFLARQRARRGLRLHVPSALLTVRLMMLGTGTILAAVVPIFSWIAFFTLVAGEFLDRATFYDELEIPTPASLMLDQLKARSS